MKKLLYIVIVIIAAGTLSALGRDAKVATAKSEVANKAMSDYFFMEGVNQKVLGNSDAAMALFDEALRLNPSAIETQYERALILVEHNAFDSAYHIMQEVIARDSTRQQYNYLLVSITAHLQLYDECEKALLRIIRHNPDESIAYVYMASLYSEQKMYDKALECIDMLEESNGLSPEIITERANLYVMLNDTTRAINTCRDLITAYPYNEQSFTLMGQLYNIYQMYPQEEEVLKQGLETHPQSLLLHSLLGKYYIEHNDSINLYRTFDNILLLNINDDERNQALEELTGWIYQHNGVMGSVDVCREWVDRQPHNEHARRLYIYYLKGAGMQDEFLTQLAILANENDEGGELWEQVAMEYITLNKSDEAISAGTKAIAAGNTTFNIYYIMAISHSIKEEYNPAFAYATEAADRCDKSLFVGGSLTAQESRMMYDKTMSDIIGLQGDIAYKMNNIEQCYQLYDSALVYYPDNVNILNNYAYNLVCNNGDIDKAEKMALKALQNDNNTTPAYIDTYAWILFKKGQYTLARIYIERAMVRAQEEGENIALYYEHYGDILAMDGDTDKAVEQWKKALEAGATSTTLKKKIELRKYIEE